MTKEKSKIVLLDRDGVINEDSDNYIRSVEEWIPITSSIEAIARLHQNNYQVYVITNQSGIGRGYYSLETLAGMHKKMNNLIEQAGGKVSDIAFCPHTPDAQCECRKPKTGLLQKIAKDHNLDLTGVPFIGDSLTDIQCAHRAGANGILVKTGKGLRTLEKAKHSEEAASALQNVPVFDNLAQFVDHFLE